jgi:thymidylate synthase ThyX
MINAQILLDSLNPKGDRLTTWILTYPRIILAEINTHRVLSRNTSSSRAIPVAKLLEQVKTNPFIPTHFGKNQPGMQANEELDDTNSVWREDLGGLYLSDREYAKALWLRGRDRAVETAEALVKAGLHKQIANRVLEPWLYVTSLVSGTDWENVFALRAHPDAQPEFRKLAYLMLDLYQRGNPIRLKEGEWHIPFGDKIDEKRLIDGALAKINGEKWWERLDGDVVLEKAKLNIATARCARVSYLNFDGKDDYEADMKLTLERLAPSGHWSAFEHCAEAMGESKQCGNFVGWKQYRKFFPNENRRDGRVQRYKAI